MIVNVRFIMAKGSRKLQRLIEKMARIIENIKTLYFKYTSLLNFDDFLFDVGVRILLPASMVVPSGHIQPQKKRPRNGVRTSITIPGRKREEILIF